MGRINSRNKGAGAEREFARLLFDHLGVRLVRNLDQTRAGGFDLLPDTEQAGPVVEVLRSLAIEVKRYASITPSDLERFWRQTLKQAGAIGKVPVLAYREDRRPWRVVVPLHLLNPDLHPGLELTWCAVLSVEGFCAVVREREGDGHA